MVQVKQSMRIGRLHVGIKVRNGRAYRKVLEEYSKQIPPSSQLPATLRNVIVFFVMPNVWKQNKLETE
ncbi:hypothetical protein OUZ56_007127 [Daphnia magna]|uniref:Uncharacterized protein n=1 Tax=Daphnia magna TaxID=35525 RepID=A0ABQ9YXN4_9CRUS|nr:hypothetical protein OUZ56_007127 [Daphnia magna]